jgi:hypothetical protein
MPQYAPSVIFWDIETTTRKNDVKDIKTVSEPYMISVVYQKGNVQDRYILSTIPCEDIGDVDFGYILCDSETDLIMKFA